MWNFLLSTNGAALKFMIIFSAGINMSNLMNGQGSNLGCSTQKTEVCIQDWVFNFNLSFLGMLGSWDYVISSTYLLTLGWRDRIFICLPNTKNLVFWCCIIIKENIYQFNVSKQRKVRDYLHFCSPCEQWFIVSRSYTLHQKNEKYCAWFSFWLYSLSNCNFVLIIELKIDIGRDSRDILHASRS